MGPFEGMEGGAASEVEHAGGAQNPACFALLELVADLPLTAGGLGIGVRWLVGRKPPHQATFHHLELIMAPVALGRGTCQFLQVDRREIAALDDGIAHQLAIAAAAGTLHKHVDLGGPVAVEVSHFGSHNPAVDRLMDRLDRRSGAGGGDRQLLQGTLAAAVHLEADPLLRQDLVKGGTGPGDSGQSGGQKQAGGGEVGKQALQGGRCRGVAVGPPLDAAWPGVLWWPAREAAVQGARPPAFSCL